MKPVEPPAVKNRQWPDTPVDRFLLARLEQAGLSPAPDCDRPTLLRRVTFDLTGLPPTPEELADFQNDTTPDAFQRVVDRLLASPRYGERWGRHWLDLVRYAETSGHEFDYDIPTAWRYRDYVIRALNTDVPFDQFVVEHLAGDLLDRPRREPLTATNELILGTGFFFLGEGTHSPVDIREEQLRRIDNQIDVLGKAFLGLTIACARCHDHKFDPISQRDYYALAGYLKSSRHQQAVLDPPSTNSRQITELDTLRDQIASLLPPPPPASQPVTHSPRQGTILFEDFTNPDFNDWTTSGQAFGAGPTQGPSLRVERVEDLPSASWITAGWAHSGLQSDRLAGALRSPTFTLDHSFIHILALGRSARINLVIDGFEKIRAPIYGGLTQNVNSPDQPRWFTIDTSLWTGHRAYIEFSDGLMIDYTGSPSKLMPEVGFVAVDEVWFSQNPEPPFAPGPPLRGMSLKAADTQLAALIDRYHQVETTIEPPTLGLAVLDGTGENESLLPRGNHRSPGDEVARRFLEVLENDGIPETSTQGSGRLDLAHQIVNPRANPLTPRVLVNRLWHHHYGRGIVPTVDDFGHMGELPSHPELLDYLANTLVESGWSLKSLHRLLVTSRAYRMSSTLSPDAQTIDPDNRLLHRMPVRRLEAEAIRDAMLATSGRLIEQPSGPGVPPFLTPYMDGRGRPAASGPLDGDGRRGIYLAVRRNFLSPMLLAFDLPTPASTLGRRHVTNVPAQALTLLNDPFVIEQARLWANRILQEAGSTPEARLHRMYLEAFSRPPTMEEQAQALAFLRGCEGEREAEAWADLAHVLFNVKSFVYLD